MLKTLSKSIREYKKDSILSPVFVAIEVILDVLIPFTMAMVIDNGVKKSDMSYIYKMGGIMLLIAAFSLVFGILAGNCAAKASAGFAKNLRKDMFSKIQTYSFANIDNFSNSSLVTRLTTDVSNVQLAFQMLIRIMVRAPFMIIFAFVATVSINLKLSLVFAAAIPFLGAALLLIIKYAMPNFRKLFKKYDDVNLIVGENLRGIRTVKSFVREDEQINKFKNESGQLRNFALKAERLITWNGPILQFTVYACIILVSLFGAKFVILGELSTGNMLSFYTYIFQILMNLMNLSMVLVMFSMAKPSCIRIMEVLNEESNIKNIENPIMNVADGSISFNNVSFGYVEEKMVLENINFDIKSGQTIGILGGTGSSKSSFVNLLSRLYDVSNGEITIANTPIKNYDIKTLRDNVAVVLQKNILFSGPIKENLLWGNKNATDEDIIKACKLAQAYDFVMALPDKFDTIIDQGGTNVSGGQRQRLCIARALLKTPKILILDDSTSAVDTKTDALIRNAFIKDIPDVTKIIVAQRISSIEDSDQIIVLEDGKINGVGTHNSLLISNEIYREIYESQVKGVDNNA